MGPAPGQYSSPADFCRAHTAVSYRALVKGSDQMALAALLRVLLEDFWPYFIRGPPDFPAVC